MNQKTQNSALQVANSILQRSLDEDRLITHLKLQKLLYILHGWHLSIQGTPAFQESIEAWAYGPVVASVYRRFKHCGDQKIEEKDIGGKALQVSRKKDPGLHTILDMVWKNYKDRTSFELVDLTHARGTPWDIVYSKDIYVRHAVIDNELIKSYYDGLIESFRERKDRLQDHG